MSGRLPQDDTAQIAAILPDRQPWMATCSIIEHMKDYQPTSIQTSLYVSVFE